MGSWWPYRICCLGILLPASILVLFFLEFVQLQQRQLLLLLYQSRLDFVRLQLVLEYHNVFDRRGWRRPHPYYWNLPWPWNSCFHRRNIPEDIARCEKRLEQTLIKTSFIMWRNIIAITFPLWTLYAKDTARGGGTPIWNRRGCSSEIFNFTPKGDQSGRGLRKFWP